MLITRFMAIPLIGILLIPGACAPASAPMPKPAAFTTSALTITPGTVKPGETVTVGVTVTNTGEQQGTYTVVVKLHDGTIVRMQDVTLVKTQNVTLAGGAKQNVTLNISMSSVGTHMVMIDKLSGKLVVQETAAPTPTQPATAPAAAPTPTQPAPAPATGPAAFTTGAFTISDLRIVIDAEMAEPGGTVTVSVKVTNNGGQPGTYTVVLKVDGATVKTQDVTLAGGTSQQVNLTITVGNIGTYTISIGQLTGKLEVMAH